MGISMGILMRFRSLGWMTGQMTSLDLLAACNVVHSNSLILSSVYYLVYTI